MHFTTTYEEALASHPDVVTEVIVKLRKSRSKHRNAPPETLTWSYEVGVRVQGYSFTDLFSGKAEVERARQAALTEQEEVAELQSKCLVSLQAGLGHAFYMAPVPKASPPKSVLDWSSKTVQERRRRQAEADALTQDERALVVEEAVKQLAPLGLVCITVKRPTP